MRSNSYEEIGVKGIYCIENILNGKKYIGQSSNVKTRITSQRCNLKNPNVNKKSVNVLLHKDVQKLGIDNFKFYVLQEMPSSTQKEREVVERLWMVKLESFVDQKGYNIRSDCEKGMVCHNHTRLKQSFSNTGSDNPNYGHRWTEEQKDRMSKITKERHRSGLYYDESWRKNQGERSKKFWSENPEKRQQMSEKVKLSKEKYRFHQYTKTGEFIRSWDSMSEIVKENDDFHVQAIYAVCDGHKKSYRGFVWKKELKI